MQPIIACAFFLYLIPVIPKNDLHLLGKSLNF